MTAVVKKNGPHVERTQEPPSQVSDSNAIMGNRERIVAELAYAKWVGPGRPPGAWKIYWYEASIELEE